MLRFAAVSLLLAANSALAQAVPGPSAPTPPDCREAVARAVCFVNSPATEMPYDQLLKRPCLPDTARYIPAMQALYDQYPPALKRMFCSVRRIFIEHGFTAATAYSSPIPAELGGGAAIGMRQELMDSPTPFSLELTWKEQLNFGGNPARIATVPWLPQVRARGFSGNETLYYIFAHEFGHLFDFANGVNHFDFGPGNPSRGGFDPHLDPRAIPGSWSSISWASLRRVLPGADYPGRAQLCFYNCKEHPIGVPGIAPLYEGWARSDFITQYAATNPYDDFAETVAIYALSAQPGGAYLVSPAPGVTYDVVAKFRSPLFARKRAYLFSLLRSPGVRYP